MTAKPETAFIKRIHSKFKTIGVAPYFEKMHNAYRGGTWDVWYSGNKGDMWIEYKWSPKAFQWGILIPPLTPLQAKWGRQRENEGRLLRVVYGCPTGCQIFYSSAEWEAGHHVLNLISETDTARWISDVTGEGDDSPSRGAGRKNRRIVL